MRKGHRARERRANVTCSNCGQHSHHVSLCESKDKQLSPNAREFEVLPEREDAKPSALSPSTLHVGSGGGELRYKQRGRLSGGRLTLTGLACCSMLVVIARSSLLRPLSARSFLLLGRIG